MTYIYMILKGYNHKTGDYEGKPYDNYQLFGIDDRGQWMMEKVSGKVVKDSGIYDINALLENEIVLLYNRYGKVESIKMG